MKNFSLLVMSGLHCFQSDLELLAAGCHCVGRACFGSVIILSTVLLMSKTGTHRHDPDITSRRLLTKSPGLQFTLLITDLDLRKLQVGDSIVLQGLVLSLRGIETGHKLTLAR
jgi:uncharacterized membrane protein